MKNRGDFHLHITGPWPSAERMSGIKTPEEIAELLDFTPPRR